MTHNPRPHVEPEVAAECPRDCTGQVTQTSDLQVFECTKCGNRLRRVVVSDLERFKRVADSDGPAAPIAQAALGLDSGGA